MPSVTWRNYLKSIPELIGIGLLYFIAGRLAMLLAIPPGFAMAVFPPAGIALGAALVSGVRVLPAVALGSFLLNISINWSNGQPLNETMVAVALMISLGATLQTFASAHLIHALIGKELTLSHERSIYLFFLTGGPVGCVISATIGVSALMAMDFVPLENFLTNWSTWWIGDTLGVMTITPLILVLFGEPREIWRTRIRSVLLPLSACLLVVTFAFVFIHQHEEQKQYNDFTLEMERITQNLQNNLNSLHDTAYDLTSFFSAVETIDRASFRTFVRHPLQIEHNIAAIAWAQQVPQAQRKIFEKRQQENGYPGFQIVALDNTGRASAAGVREVYYPLTFVEPASVSQNVLGIDLSLTPQRQFEIEDARDSGNITVSDPVHFGGTPQGSYLVLMYIPVYQHGKQPQTQAERRAVFEGVAIIALRMNRVFDSLLSDENKRNMRIKFYDLSFPSAGGVFYDDIGQNKTQFLYQTKLSFGARQYAMIVQPTTYYWEEHISWVTWFSMFNGLLFTGMLGMYLLVVSAHTINVETLVTERTAQLHDSEERLRAILSNAAEGILTTDASGFIESANESAERLFGLQRGAMFGRNLTDLFEHGSSDDLLQKYLSDHDSAPVQFRQEVVAKKRDLQEIPLELAIAKTRFGNQILLVVIMHDLSERKRVDKLKGEFVATVSHELRTPLTSIRGSLGLLAEGLGGTLPAKAQTLLNLANDNAVRLTDLINDLLDFEKLEYGGLHFNIQKFNLKMLLQSASKANRGYAERFSVSMVFHPYDGKDIFILVDQQRIVQVLSNLLSNAIKFSPKYGQVDVVTSVNMGWVRVSVTDHGIGISETFQANIFKKFMQEDSQAARKYPGTGLGLSLSKSMIEKMGGRINFHSVEGQGSTFYIEFRIVT